MARSSARPLLGQQVVRRNNCCIQSPFAFQRHSDTCIQRIECGPYDGWWHPQTPSDLLKGAVARSVRGEVAEKGPFHRRASRLSR
jgi:hypothetical protein